MSQYLKILLSDTQGQFIFSVNTDGNAQAGTYATSVEYSFDNDTWSTLQLNSGNNTIQLRWGGGSTELHLRNDSGVWSSPGSYAYWYITISCTVDYEIMEGSLSALLDYNDDSVVPPAGAFARLFKNDTHLTSFMPEFVTETLSNNLCEEMFYGCTNLTSASLEFTGYPTTIPYSCFLDTFHGCTSLSDGNISVLAMADTFGDRSCEGMFTGCTSLNDFASFPMQASTLGSSCFEEMYYGCTNANEPDNLTLPATTLAQSCYKGMFRNCTSLDKGVILPATSVLAYSYQQMFSGCTSLSEVVTYADTINTTYPGTANWLQNVAATGTVYNMGNATYTVDSASGIPVGWSEVQLQSSYTVTATAGQNGSISPSGAVTVNTFDSQSFTFTPAAGYEVDTVTVDGSTVSNPGFSYFFSNVTADHTISVTFKELSDYFYIERTSGSGYWTITITQTQESTPTGTYATSIEYSTDGLRWIRRTLYSGTNYISSETNKVYFRNDSGNWSTTGLYNKFNVNNNVPHITGGNPNSLLDYTDMDNVSLSESCFYSLFYYDTNLTSASDLRLSNTVAPYCYMGMFRGCSSLTTAPSLPATTLVDGCYSDMFRGCTSLTSAPTLPATTLASNCYSYMFNGCNHLTTAPALPATTLAGSCYAGMFSGCTSLTTAPVLPATTLANRCYNSMFSGCTSLNEVTTYADDISATNCLNDWLQNVSNSGTLYNNGSATYTPNSASGIPTGWTEVGPTPSTYTITATAGSNGSISPSGAVTVNVGASQTFTVTPDTGYIVDTLTVDGVTATLTNDTYTFSNVQADHTISVTFKLPDLTDYFYIENTYNGQNTVTLSTSGSSASQASSVEYSKDQSTWTTLTLTAGGTNTITLETGEKVYFRNDSGMWNSGTSNYTKFSANQSHIVGGNVNTLLDYTNLNSVTLRTYCFYYLFLDNTTLTSAANLSLPSTTLANNCYASMFKGCTSLTSAPTLPATTLAQYCYNYMFSGCTSLTSAPVLPATTLANRCYNSMFSACTSLNSVTTYADDISATNCLNYWLQNVSNSGTLYNMGSATYPTNSVSGIPTGWTEVGPTPSTYTITATAGSNGSISPSGSVSVNAGASQTFTVTPDTGYIVDTLTVDGSTATLTNNTYTFSNVQADHTISVTFKLPPAVIRYNAPTAVSGNWVTNNTDTTQNTYDSVTGNGVLYLNSGVTTIGGGRNVSYSPFFGKTDLVSADLSDSGLTTIGDNVFTDCLNMTTFVPTTGLTTIGKESFKNCYAISSFTIPNTVTSIGSNAFYGCHLTSLVIPESVTSLGGNIVASCTFLTSITVDSNNSTYDSRNNCNAIIETSTNKLISGCSTTVIPNTVTSLGNGSFAHIPITSLVIPESVTSLGTYTFQGCVSLTSVNIPSGVTSIGNNVFDGCIGLQSIVIPSGVTSIGNNAFKSCSSLTSVTCWKTTPPTLGTNNFEINNDTLYVPVGCVPAYQADSAWNSAFTTITEIPHYTIVASVDGASTGSGSISPSGSSIFYGGETQTYTISADSGSYISDVVVDGNSVGAVSSYTFTNIAADHTIEVTFELVSHTITATAHENANISPSGPVSVLEGDDQSFSVYPDAGYEISDVEVDGSSVGAVTEYTFYNVTSDHTIDVYAIPIPPAEHQIMAFGYDHASINPSGTITVTEGNDQTFTMAADAGYQISDVLVDGSSVGAVSSYTFTDVQDSHEIAVYGEPIPVPTYNCSVTVATTGGSVMPLSATVDEGQDITFTVTTEEGYAIDNLIDNGTDVTSRMVGNTYTISNVSADHTLSISFVRVVIQYSIVSTAGEGGSISPLGRTYVDEGSSQTYTITPDEGNEIDRLIVDGHEVTPAATYTFENVVSDHTIEATFKETPPPPPPVPDYGLDLSEMIDTDYVAQYGTK